MGILLTGGGDDGVRGLINIKAAGGISIVQNPDEAKTPSMPMNALLYDHVDLVLSLQDSCRGPRPRGVDPTYSQSL